MENEDLTKRNVSILMHGEEAKEAGLAMDKDKVEAFQWLAEATKLGFGTISGIYKFFDYSRLETYSLYEKRIDYKKGKRRVCWEPLPLLKLVQARINDILSAALKHPCNFGFSGGRIEEAILPHLNSEALLSMDITAAFHHTKKAEVLESLERSSLPAGVPEIIAQICTFPVGPNCELVIPQGAPSSPRLFDLVMRPVDEELNEVAKRTGLKYTRYADNPFISGDLETLRLVKRSIIKIASRGGWYKLHKIKIRELPVKPGQAVRVLGLNIIYKNGRREICNTREFTRRLRAVTFYSKKSLENGEDPEFTKHILNVLNGLMGWARKETLAPSIREQFFIK